MVESEEFKVGRLFVQKNKPKDALPIFQRELMKLEDGEMILRSNELLGLERFPPDLLSYYGLCTALVEKRFQVGITLCKAALEADMLRSDFYLNLGKVYLRANKKSQAIDVFRKGVDTTENTREIKQELNKLGVRGTPFLKILSRGHPINKFFGKLLYRFKQGKPGK